MLFMKFDLTPLKLNVNNKKIELNESTLFLYSIKKEGLAQQLAPLTF